MAKRCDQPLQMSSRSGAAMNDVEIKTIIQKWIDDVTTSDVKAVFANQNAPRPAYPYITIHKTVSTETEHSTVEPPDENGISDIVDDQTISISLQSFGNGASDIMSGLRDELKKVTTLQYFRDKKMPFIRILSGVNDLTDVVASRQEERAGMDLEFRAANVVKDNVGLIESVTGTGEFEITSIEKVDVTFETGV
jgi:hypothetical protein